MCSTSELNEKPGERRPRHNWSITRRLTLLCAASSFLMLVLATLGLYWAVGANLEREDGGFLADKVRGLRNLLRDRPLDSGLLKGETQIARPMPQSLQYQVRILNAAGQTIAETPGMSNLLGVAAFPRPWAVDEEIGQGRELRLPGGSSFRLISAWAEAGAAGSQICLLQLALDVSNDEVLLAEMRQMMRFTVFLGVVLSGVAGVFIAKKTLQPLAELTQATERITVSQLHERVIPGGWPKELASLARGFDRMMDRLEEAFNRLSQFSGDLAHELRTPINNLRGEAGVALSQVRTPEQYRRVLESSLEEYARLGRLVDNLLFLARADGAMTRIHPAACEARQALEVVREYYGPLAEDRGVEVVCEGQALVHADQVLLRQAVSNLLANALNHTPQGGRVRLSLLPGERGMTLLAVHDTGCGIAAEHLPKIFDRFYRVDSPPSQPAASGFGLGLSIVKSIMALHDGSVSVESVPGQGSTFTLRFPAPPAVRR